MTALYRLGELLKCERTVKFLACNPAGKLMVSAQVMVFASRGGAENLILCVSDNVDTKRVAHPSESRTPLTF
jgi:hypothetical protein